jgi:hypothetical protein
MWIFTTSGFVSAVSNPDGTIKVRSRDKASLEPLSKRYELEITHTPIADYPYRLEISAENFADWVAVQAKNIDYPNFKSAVAIHRNRLFAKVLGEVWSVMHGVEDKSARSR